MPRVQYPEPKVQSPEPKTARSAAPLTPRERSVVAAVLEGSTNKAIAAKLGLREQTVKNHLSSIFAKLGLANRLELALFAMERKMNRVPEGSGIGDRRGTGDPRPGIGDRSRPVRSSLRPDPKALHAFTPVNTTAASWRTRARVAIARLARRSAWSRSWSPSSEPRAPSPGP